MYTKWTSHIKDPEVKKHFEGQVVSAKDVLDRVHTLLREEEHALERSEVDIKSFDSPNWAYKQAYKNGYRASLGFVTKLIDLDQQETK